jgi:hypothetical protein
MRREISTAWRMKISESIYSNMILLHVSNLPAYALNMPNCEHSKHILYPVERATPPQGSQRSQASATKYPIYMCQCDPSLLFDQLSAPVSQVYACICTELPLDLVWMEVLRRIWFFVEEIRHGVWISVSPAQYLIFRDTNPDIDRPFVRLLPWRRLPLLSLMLLWSPSQAAPFKVDWLSRHGRRSSWLAARIFRPSKLSWLIVPAIADAWGSTDQLRELSSGVTARSYRVVPQALGIPRRFDYVADLAVNLQALCFIQSRVALPPICWRSCPIRSLSFNVIPGWSSMDSKLRNGGIRRSVVYP